ncbi:unnamed protein product [Ectocarpus sp. CCAP 1310/34]|nr:unnamed protein product [Ectocarpus sp. CCAP 1310/34]
MAPSSKKRKTGSATPVGATAAGADGAGAKSTSIELLDKFKKLRASWPKEMARLLDPSLPDERRSELWEIMCSGGDVLRQRFAWAIPDERALRIIKHFGPIVEIGSGLGYWAKLLRARGVDINAYDKVAGTPDTASAAPDSSRTKGKSTSKDAKVKSAAEGVVKEDADEGGGDETPSFWIKVNEGGPDVLEEPCNEGRSLFLCYPDDFEGETESLGLRCLHAFEGDVVIHVGELFGDSVSMTPGQSPWGRTTSQECQEELASKFHCILKVPLPSWPHSRDTLTVWKRHSFCSIQYDDDDDDDSDDNEADEKSNGGDDGSKAQGKEQGGKGKKSSPNGGGGDDREANGKGRKGGKKAEGSGKDGSDGDDSDDSHSSSGSDDFGSIEGLPIGMLDVDMYAFVPEDETMPCAQAAPCARFLLDAEP